MIQIAIGDLIGIGIDDDYPWADTLVINHVAAHYDGQFDKCRAKILVKMCRDIDTSDCRKIENGIYASGNTFIDMEYGVRLERPNANLIILEVNQECNEWIILCLQLLLLELDCSIIHGAAVEKNGKVILFPSWGGVGKTAIVMTMVEKYHWKILGDDMIILNHNKILPYLKPFYIYPYHKTLFPKLFKDKKHHIISVMKLNSILERIIPSLKKALRSYPKLLAYLRKHNVQSMRISPMEIFEKEQISTGGEIIKIVWLERIQEDKTKYMKMDAKNIVSKTISVTMMELFAGKLNYLYALYGAGIFDFEEIHIKMYNLIYDSFNASSCYELDIPNEVSINEVGEIVYNYVG